MTRTALPILVILGVVWAARASIAQTAADFDGDGRSNVFDNCPFVANPGQLDASVPQNDVGDACECGDTQGSGRFDLADVAVLRRALAGLAPGVADVAKCSVVGGSMDCDVADVARMRAALAGSAALLPVCRAFVGAGELPGRMAVAGDSITRAFAASCECNLGFSCLLDCVLGGTEQPQYSYFNGSSSDVFSLLDRYRFFDVAISANGSAAATGARMRGGSDSFSIQADRILAQSPAPDLAVVLLGGNDICSRDCAQAGHCGRPLFTDAEFREAVELGLDALTAGLPDGAAIYLGSVPRVQDLVAAGLAKQDAESDVDCELAWEVFDICRIATDPGSLSGETQAFRLAAIAARQRRYNEILVETAADYASNANGQNPRGLRVVAEYSGESSTSVGTLHFGPDEINGSDCFHPSILGQNAVAERLWLNSPVR